MQIIDNTKLVANWVNVKKLNENAQLPTQGSEWSAGWDLYACIDEPVSINPHTTVKIGTGLAFELPKYTFGGIFPRSGLATKKGLRPANCVGVIDADYRGEVIVALHNDTNETMRIDAGERIAQLVIMDFTPVVFKPVDELSTTVRGEGGFGSTGAK